MKSTGYLAFLLITLLGCSTKKYLPRIFDPEKTKKNVTHRLLYFENDGKSLSLEIPYNCMIAGYYHRDNDQSVLTPESEVVAPMVITGVDPTSHMEQAKLTGTMVRDFIDQEIKAN